MKTAARFTYSAFLRGPSDILPALERGDVVLERRDGVDLVLSTTDRANASHDGLDVGAATLAQIAIDHPRFTHDLNAWRITAEVWSDPDLAARLHGEFIGDIGEVPALPWRDRAGLSGKNHRLPL